MGTTHLNYQREVMSSADELLAWHGRPGAFQRLTPVWAHTSIVEEHGSIHPGDWKKLRVGSGPFRFNWTIGHKAIDGCGFADVQESGPFADWQHVHRFRDIDGTSSTLEDQISYALPLNGITAPLFDRQLRSKLDDLFWFRQFRTANDLFRHRASGLGTPKRIAVSGATGLVGRHLSDFLTTGGHEVYPIVRSPGDDPREIRWDPARGEIDAARLEGMDAVVHLAGESIAKGRWTAAKRERILRSRVQGTSLLATTLASLRQPPDVFVSASAVGFYGDSGERTLTESSPQGDGFLADVCRQWEAAAEPARQAGIRVVHPRFGIVIAGGGGMLTSLLPPFRLGMGGRVSQGDQYMSWIAIDDLLAILLESMANRSICGPVNAVSPFPVTNREFTKALARAIHRPAIVPIPAPALRLAFGGMADELLIAGQRAIPARLAASNFHFALPDIEDCLRLELGSLTTKTKDRLSRMAIVKSEEEARV